MESSSTTKDTNNTNLNINDSSVASNSENYSIKQGDENYEDSLKIAENYKNEGNELLQQNKFLEALEKYTKAIDLKIETKKNAIYFSNRAMVNLKLENYGSTIQDANDALKADPDYIKAYFRRATAYGFLRKFDEALKDLLFLKTKIPEDKTLDEKITKIKNERKRKNFFEAYSSEGRGKQTLSQMIKNATVASSYTGPVFPEDGKIDLEWVKKLIEFIRDDENVKSVESKTIHKKYMLLMLQKGKEILSNYKEALVDINIPEGVKFNVVGDVHGQFYDLLNIFKIQGFPSESNMFLFNGDFVDRGVFGVECVVLLLAFKILYPNHFFLARGNHEGRNMNRMYGFQREVTDKFGDESVYEGFIEFFYSLPLGHILNKEVLVVHGGIFSKDGVKIEELKKINRFCEIPDSGLFCELLWADPCKENGRIPSKRGLGMAFGPDVAKRFLEDNNLKLLVRSHEVKMEGYEIEPGDQVITVFSAPNYCDSMGNKGAIIEFTKEKNKDSLTKNFVKFEAVKHPNVNIRKYMSGFMF